MARVGVSYEAGSGEGLAPENFFSFLYGKDAVWCSINRTVGRMLVKIGLPASGRKFAIA